MSTHHPFSKAAIEQAFNITRDRFRLSKRLPLTAESGTATLRGWQTTPPPTDREIIIIANIIGEEGDGAHYSVPYLGRARWDKEHKQWLGEDDLTICRYATETLRIHYWIDDPSTPIEIPGTTLTQP